MTDELDRREGGAWIGQHPDPNTEEVRRNLDPAAERVSVTDNEAGDARESDDQPQGHAEPGPADGAD